MHCIVSQVTKKEATDCRVLLYIGLDFAKTAINEEIVRQAQTHVASKSKQEAG